MPIEPIVLDSVRFFDISTGSNLPLEGTRQITDLAMIPLRGDFVRIGQLDRQFIVVDRRFHFSHGAFFMVVNVQPADRDT